MIQSKPTVTIDQAFEKFLAEQEARLSPSTFSKYESILDLLRSCLESYWPGHDQEEYNRITKSGGTFCGTFGPEEVLGGLSEFLGYFMPRKVIAGKDTMKAAGTVTKKLVKWLAEKGYVAADEGLDLAEERAARAVRDLPASQDVVNLLEAYIDEHSPARYSRELEDHFTVTRIEPSRLWLEPLASGDREIGPVPVPREVSDVCRVGWDISGVVVKTSKGWRLTEVWNVSP
jgi:hypothetical protein